jgi:hypothetical protein
MSVTGTRRDWEATLRSWTGPASDSEDERRQRTERAIAGAIRNSEIPASAVRVYVKGSAANNTNVRADSDIDVAVEYTSIFYFDLTGDVAHLSRSDFEIPPATGRYAGPDGPALFKQDVNTALIKAFGLSSVSRGNKAIAVRESRQRLAADVVPCFEYRRYFQRSYLAPQYHQGTVILPDHGARVENWPRQHYDNGVAKNLCTGRRYKRLVRAIKRLENEMVDRGVTPELPSYLTECLAYNAPDDCFNRTSYLADLRAVLATIYNETRSAGDVDKWVEVNELKWLFSPLQRWSREQAFRFADTAWDYVGFD